MNPITGTQKTCYQKMDGGVQRQTCMYTANGEMTCNVKGDGVAMILGDKCAVAPHGGNPASSVVVTGNNSIGGGCVACGGSK